jgi:tRNA (guanine-N7-)-methyltransferase
MMAARHRYRQHGNPFSLRGPIELPDARGIFGRDAPMALEVGFGRGAFLLELARRHPEWNVLGLEIRRHLVDELNATAEGLGIANARAVLANANEHLEALVPKSSVVMVTLNFPDPWYKKRHHKRRVVRPEWLSLLGAHLRDGAEIHVMTDYAPLAREIRTVCEAQGLENLDGPGNYAAQSTTSIVSERERTHQRRGEPIYRLRFRYHRR